MRYRSPPPRPPQKEAPMRDLNDDVRKVLE